MTKIYIILNRHVADNNGMPIRPSISADQMNKPNTSDVWCVNYRNWNIEESELIGVNIETDEHYVVIKNIREDNGVWAVPPYNIFYNKRDAEKGLFKARLKYEG